MSLTSPTHQQLLKHFAQRFRKEHFQNRLVSASAEIPYDVLLVTLPVEEEQTEIWSLELSFMPNLEDQLNAVSLLQCFIRLPITVTEASLHELYQFILKLNLVSPLVGFGYMAEQEMVCFRYTLMLPDEEDTAANIVIQTAWTISYLLSLFAESLAAIASGEQTIAEALVNNPYSYLFE